jgi:hypothetical protein
MGLTRRSLISGVPAGRLIAQQQTALQLEPSSSAINRGILKPELRPPRKVSTRPSSGPAKVTSAEDGDAASDSFTRRF